MKELSIEDKAQRYDEVIRKAKITLDCCGSTSIETKNTIYDIFPELKELEDERIRGAIIDHLKDNNLMEWVDWLEKQWEKGTNGNEMEIPISEQKSAWNEEDEKLFRCAIDAVKQESKVRTDGCLDEEVGEMVTNWLKSLKDRVQPQNTWKPSDEQMQALCSKLPLLTGSGNEVQRVLETLYCDLKKLRNE